MLKYGEEMVGIAYRKRVRLESHPETSLELGMMRSESSAVEKWTWRIAFCERDIYIEPAHDPRQ